MLKNTFSAILLVCLGAFLPACAADIGEACATKGSTDECVDGAVCELKGTSDAEPVCLMICKDSSECATNEDCNGVTGSNVKACQAKK